MSEKADQHHQNRFPASGGDPTPRPFFCRLAVEEIIPYADPSDPHLSCQSGYPGQRRHLFRHVCQAMVLKPAEPSSPDKEAVIHADSLNWSWSKPINTWQRRYITTIPPGYLRGSSGCTGFTVKPSASSGRPGDMTDPQPSDPKGIIPAIVSFSRFKIFFDSVIIALAAGSQPPFCHPESEEEPQIVVAHGRYRVNAPGASPSEIEQLVSIPLERFLWQIDGVEYVYSISQRHGRNMARFFVGEDREDSLIKVRKTEYPCTSTRLQFYCRKA